MRCIIVALAALHCWAACAFAQIQLHDSPRRIERPPCIFERAVSRYDPVVISSLARLQSTPADTKAVRFQVNMWVGGIENDAEREAANRALRADVLAALLKLNLLEYIAFESNCDDPEFYRALAKLKHLCAFRCWPEPRNLAAMIGWPSLQALRLDWGSMPDGLEAEGFESIAKMKQLRILSYGFVTPALDPIDFCETAMGQIAHLADLEELALQGQIFAPGQFKNIARLKKLRVLDVSNSQPDGAWAGELAHLSGLEELILYSEYGYPEVKGINLGALRSLKSLTLGWTGEGFQDVCRIHEGISELPALTHLDLRGVYLNTEACSKLRTLASLQTLKLLVGGPDVPTAAWYPVKSPLRQLVILGGFVDAEGAALIANTATLEALEFHATTLALEGAGMLSRLPSLRELVMVRSGFANRLAQTDLACEAIAKISSLERVVMSNCYLTDAGLGHLCRLPRLRSLDVTRNSRLDGAGFASLGDDNALEELALSENFFSGDKGILSLAKARRLQTLIVSELCDETFIVIGEPTAWPHFGSLSSLRTIRMQRSPAFDAREDKNGDIEVLPHEFVESVSKLEKLELLVCPQEPSAELVSSLRKKFPNARIQ